MQIDEKLLLATLINENVVSENAVIENFKTATGRSNAAKFLLNDSHKNYLVKVIFVNAKYRKKPMATVANSDLPFQPLVYSKLIKSGRQSVLVNVFKFAEGTILSDLLKTADEKTRIILAKKLSQLLFKLAKTKTNHNAHQVRRLILHTRENMALIEKLIAENKINDDLTLTVYPKIKAAYFEHAENEKYLQLGLSHGDFHFENIVVDKHKHLTLIDYFKVNYNYQFKDLAKLTILEYDNFKAFILVIWRELLKKASIAQKLAINLVLLNNLISYIKNNYNFSTYKIKNIAEIYNDFFVEKIFLKNNVGVEKTVL